MNDHEFLTAEEVIAYLRLDALGGNAKEHLRNLIRRQQLPVITRGRLKLFRRSAIEAWAAAGERGNKSNAPARLHAAQGLAARNGRAHHSAPQEPSGVPARRVV
jgi:helix-turn-helix protein